MNAEARRLAAGEPVRDSIAQINHEVAVGEDLEFQRSWWKFERAIWVFFVLLIALDLAGVFGRGPLAHARMRTPSGALDVQYERVERTGTPSMMTVTFGPGAVSKGMAELYVGDSVVSGLGAQRIVPQPASTRVDGDGLTYTFPLSASHGVVRFELQPSSAGHYQFSISTPGAQPLHGSVIVVP
jgi:hypothetical protein